MSRLWILGAPDPEMEKTEALLAECGEHVARAMVDGRRVRPAEAYRAEIPPGATHVVECGPAPAGVVVIDHHRPGDPGYGRPPAEFMSASSIGQVVHELARLGRLVWEETPRDIVLAAAADHCLGAAYRGECPGVDPDELMRWRVESRAAFQGRDPAALLADVEATRLALREARYIVLSPRVGHCDGPQCGCGERSYGSGDPGASTQYGTGDCYCECDDCRGAHEAEMALDMRRDPPYPELPEAAAREGAGYVSGPLVGPDGRHKYTCSGDAAQVKAFMHCWAPRQGLTGIYGDPARGFAGGYATIET